MDRPFQVGLSFPQTSRRSVKSPLKLPLKLPIRTRGWKAIGPIAGFVTLSVIRQVFGSFVGMSV